MEINKGTYDKLVEMINMFNNHETFELEGKYKGDLSREAFTRCIQFCKSQKYSEEVQQEQMDIMVRLNTDDLYRISLYGKDAITSVFKTNMLPSSGENISIMKKTQIKGIRPLLIEDISFKIDLKDELPVNESMFREITLKFPSLDKGFRYKKRFSYTDNINGLRFDFTLVKSSIYNGVEFVCHKSMSHSQVLISKDKFEAEVEVLRSNDKKRTKPLIARSLLTSLVSLYLNITDEKHFLSTDEKTYILKNYLRLCYGKDNETVSQMIKNAAYKPKDYFLGPQPVTLERKNIIPPGLGIVSILNDYTVTEKADGERYMLYIDNEGKCYLINNRLTIKYTGVKLNRLVNSLFDGELITTDVFGKKINMYGIFDVYFYNSIDVRELPLIAENAKDQKSKSRFNTMQSFAKQYADVFNNNGMSLFAKDFKYGENIFELSKSIINNQKNGKYPYKIEGLIYTPRYFAVGAQFLKDTPNNTKTWEMVFKWKPPHDNTIDFLIRYDKDKSLLVKNDKYSRIATLFVGYNPVIHERLTAKKYLTNDVKLTKAYIPKEFVPGDVDDVLISKAYLEVENVPNIVNAHPKCINGDIIEDNSIVEFAYNVEKGTELSEHWVPLRVRHDKTEMLRKFGLSHTANDYNTAMNVWKSIQYPVTEDIICGVHKISQEDIVDDDVYFSSTLDRYKYASLVMKNFHNEYVKKRQLIMKMPKGASLFDIGCGKAGDLKKWIDAGFSKVFGFDVMRDNIENRKNGAYARTLDARRTLKYDEKKTPFIYITANASHRLTPEYINSMEDIDDRYISKILWGLIPQSQIKEPSLVKYHNFVTSGFDVISCQFTIHYLFENETTLNNLIFNISNNLKKGGYFIGSCLDGFKIKEKLSHIKKNESIEGRINDRVIWNIKKLYDNDDKIKLGEQIEVYMESIGKPIKEYLVDFNLLKDKLAEKGIFMLNEEDCKKFDIEKSIESFKYTFNKVLKSDDKSQLVRDIRVMTEDEKEYSFLNSWYIFKKY